VLTHILAFFLLVSGEKRRISDFHISTLASFTEEIKPPAKKKMSRLVIQALAGLLLAAAAPADAQAFSVDTRNLVDGAFEAAFQHPNATGAAPLRGFNLSVPYPGSRSDDWTYRVQVRDDIPRKDRGADAGTFTTGTYITLQAPANLLRREAATIANTTTLTFMDIDPSWALCSKVWTPAALLSDKTPAAAGSCAPFLPDDCIRELQLQMTSFRLDSRGAVDCPSPDLPTTCSDALEKMGSPAVEVIGFGEIAHQPPTNGLIAVSFS
jgi:hypothetical protein